MNDTFPYINKVVNYLQQNFSGTCVPGLILIILLLCSGNLKSQYHAIEKIDLLNNDSIINNLMDLQLPKYWIPENHHSPPNRKVIFHSSKEFLAICMLDQSCLYSFENKTAMSAINKIFGYGFGANHHKNSFRIGWRCKDNLIEILAYWYINHKRNNQHLFFVEAGKRFFMHIDVNSEKIDIDYFIEGQEFEQKVVLFNPDKVKLKNWGYVNYPYFGEKSKTPNDMKIYLKTWMLN